MGFAAQTGTANRVSSRALKVAALAGPHAPPDILALLTEQQLPQAHAELDGLMRQNPQEPDILNLQGVAFLLEGQFSTAESAFRRALTLDPASLVARRNLGIALWHEHQLPSARQSFAVALERDPKDTLTNLYWGQIAFADHDCSAAVGSFTLAREMLGAMPVAMFMDAVCSFQLGQNHNAASLIEQMGPMPAIPADALFHFALQAGKQHDYQLARLALKRVPADYPDPYTRGYDEALAAYDAGDSAAALPILRDLISRHLATPELYDLLGNALQNQGIAGKHPKLVEEAYETYRAGIYADPRYLANFIDIGHLALTLGNYELSEQLLTEGLKQNPHAYELMVERGIAYALSSKEDEAAADFEAARGLASDNPIPYLTAAMLSIQEGRNADAAKTLQEGIDRSHPPNAWLYFLLARSLYKEGSGTPEIEAQIRDALTQAIRLDSTLTEAFALAGHVWLKSGDVREAMQFLETAHRLDPTNSHYVYALATARRMQGDSQGAAKEFQSFRQMEAANNPARMREFFIKIFATHPSSAAFHNTNDPK